jgi:hypothetical protein
MHAGNGWRVKQTNKAKIKIPWRLRGAWLEAPGASLSHIPPPSNRLKFKIENTDG